MERTKITSESVGTVFSTKTAYDLDYSWVEAGTIDCTIGPEVGYETGNVDSSFQMFRFSKIGTQFDFSLSSGTGTAGVDQIVISDDTATALAGLAMRATYLKFESDPYE